MLQVKPSLEISLETRAVLNNGAESLGNEFIKISSALSAVKGEECFVPQGLILISDAQHALPYSLKKQIFLR